jgi:hypothetical protein
LANFWDSVLASVHLNSVPALDGLAYIWLALPDAIALLDIPLGDCGLPRVEHLANL